MPLRLVLTFLAPIPVGHHVTAIPLELASLFGGGFSPAETVILCDDDTRVVYAAKGVGADTMTYENIHFPPGSSYRIAQARPPLRGRVLSCLVRTEGGEISSFETVLVVEPDPHLVR